ncbi:hypothetical protein, partial [Halovenus amylolytica]|uniref:hypothetical protein n=1 Tax=Halovenus amylolytica TaxID=2500550 RepID=UPI003F5771AE
VEPAGTQSLRRTQASCPRQRDGFTRVCCPDPRILGVNTYEDEIFERLVNADSEVDLENDFDDMAIDLQEQRELANKLEEFNSGVFEGFDLGASDD